MKRHERIPLHDHSDNDSGGRIGSSGLAPGAVAPGTATTEAPSTGATGPDPYPQYALVDTVVPHGNMGTTETVDPDAGNIHTGTLNANCVVTLSAPTRQTAIGLELRVAQDGSGGHTLSFDGSVTITGDIDPTASLASALWIETLDGGTTWVGWVIGGGGSSVGDLDDLTDVTIATPTEGDTLRYRSGMWVNEGFPAAARWELVVTGSAPPVAMTTDDETDFLYAEV